MRSRRLDDSHQGYALYFRFTRDKAQRVSRRSSDLILPFHTFSLILGVVFFAWGGIPFLVYTNCPNDQQYADWVIERSKPLYKAALQRLHIDESQCENIIEIQGGISSLHQLTKKFPNKEIVVKRLPNGLRHYSINMSTYIFLARDEIAIYSGYINALAQEER